LLKLTDTIYNSPAITGFGNVKEFEGNALENKKVFEEEANSIWYLITVPDSGIFTFDIKTTDKNDDWDFMLYEYKTKFCERIAANAIEPIRTNLSRSPITGLNTTATENFEGAGINNNYSKAVVANKNEQYVLIVNNPKNVGKKHTLMLHFPIPKKIIEEVKTKEKEEPPPATILFKISVKDAITKELISSDLTIAGLRSKTFELDTITSFQTSIPKSNFEVYVVAHSKGYMLASKEFKITSDKEVFYTEILLNEIVVGKKVNLRNIQFYGNRFDFLPSATDDLKALLSFMKKNPTMLIEIEGHVNGPNEKNTNAYKELSNNRAKAVKEYLLKNGIEEDRIKYVGYGNSQMLFPNPKSEREHSENRRVEIKILAK
jgi:outer membrane protein OmpA-like peptidoglycan-associated protein